jgi:hypothetical protein
MMIFKALLQKSFILLILLAITRIAVFAQIEIHPLEYDPLRYSNKMPANTKNLRVSFSNYIDTLDLPFFEDFSQVSALIDSIYTVAGEPILFKTLSHHGLKTGQKIFVKSYTPQYVYLQSDYYVNVLDKNLFQLFVTQAQSGLVLSDGSTILGNAVHWSKIGAKLDPNPDTLKWEDDGGTYISNRIAVNPPSLYVATFDALDANGKPYYNTDGFGKTDFLTSQAINLAGMAKDSNIILTFYLQGKGLGTSPRDRFDSLYVQFKAKNNQWYTVCSHLGSLDDFKQFAVKVDKDEYFHEAFQFKFQNFTATNGSVSSTYNVDYILLDKHIDSTNIIPIDAAINKSQTSILKKYSAMPYFQYQPSDLADKVSYTLKNNAAIFTSFDSENFMRYTDGSQSPVLSQSVAFPPAFSTTPASWTVDPKLVMVDNSKNTEIKYEVNSLTGDRITDNRIRLECNNRDSGSVKLQNYYAYDDGSAENSLSFNRARAMIRFELNQLPDTITHIDAFNPQTRYTAAIGSPATISTLIVSNDDRNLVESSTTDVVLTFNDGRDVFTRYKLAKPFIPTTKVFYIGFENTSSTSVFFGVDRNIDSSMVSVYPFPSGPWMEQKISGAFMLRPVLRANSITVGVSRATNSLQFTVYPNPAKDIVQIEGNVTKIEIKNITGQLLIKKEFALEDDKSIDINQLQAGIYLILTSSASGQSAQKLVVSK